MPDSRTEDVTHNPWPDEGEERRPERAEPPQGPVDTSNLSPGAARRFEKLMHSIDSFTTAVRQGTITLPHP